MMSWSVRRALLGAVAAASVSVAVRAQGPARPATLVAASSAGPSAGPGAGPGALPASELSVRTARHGSTWWRSVAAPARWPGTPDASPLSRAMRWRAGAPGVEWGELPLAGSGEAWRTRLVVVRLDLGRVALRLDTAFTGSLHPDWSLARAPSSAVMAVNAGQFVSSLPWGWVVLAGREYLAPGVGPTSSAFLVDSTGRVHWVHGTAVHPSAKAVRPVWAFQSYPTLLEDGAVAGALQAAGRGVDVGHRDARLALGTLRDGRVVVAMTRFDGLGETLGFVPFGLTAPEMAAVMGALGVADAVMLDGGISAQLLVRRADGEARRWPGVRRVPMALIATERPAVEEGRR